MMRQISNGRWHIVLLKKTAQWRTLDVEDDLIISNAINSTG